MSAPRTILCFGDSNTHGTPPMTAYSETRRFDAATRWTGVMRRGLPADWTVIEEGHPGRTTVHDDPINGAHKNGLRSLPVALESHRPIDLVVMMLGTNDFQVKYSVTAIDIARPMDALIATISQSAANPVMGPLDLMIVAPPPVRETARSPRCSPAPRPRHADLPAISKPRHGKYDAAFLDAGKHISVCAEDGVHFDEAAHATLGSAIADAVLARFG